MCDPDQHKPLLSMSMRLCCLNTHAFGNDDDVGSYVHILYFCLTAGFNFFYQKTCLKNLFPLPKVNHHNSKRGRLSGYEIKIENG